VISDSAAICSWLGFRVPPSARFRARFPRETAPREINVAATARVAGDILKLGMEDIPREESNQSSENATFGDSRRSPRSTLSRFYPPWRS